MTHGMDRNMLSDCPFSAMGVSLCPQNIFAMVFHHVYSFQAFINIPIRYGASTLLLTLFFLACAMFIIYTDTFLLKPIKIFGRFYKNPNITSHKRNIASWLALHENSPSI